ncbi:MAG: LuxR C-terminal-related transcriptional regulator, partial [bacterium]
ETMLEGKQILIVSTNQLVCVGLKTILTDCFSPESVETCSNLDLDSIDHSVDYMFIQPQVYVLYHERLREFGGRIVILSDLEPADTASLPATLNVTRTESEIIEKLQRIFSLDSARGSPNKKGNLTSREIDVLKLVARGQSNKQIADRLSISMHTVISHRKNITRKLGVKTVSGLTMYAVLNGLISSKDVR